jgi:hypothetical protein
MRESVDIESKPVEIPKYWEFHPIRGVAYKFDYAKIADDLNAMVASGDTPGMLKLIQVLGEEDLFFLLYFVLDCQFLNTAFHVPKIYEVQEDNSRTLDLWAREHGKTTIITYGLLIWKVLKDPNITIGIFSHTRSIAKGFLRRIKIAFETNQRLIKAWPHVVYENPEKDSQKWSEEDGIVLKRTTVVPEATIEAWGLTDNMPTSKHFSEIHYDDIETERSVTTPEQIEKTKEAFRMSHNLGKLGGTMRVIGTIYHYHGLNQKLLEGGEWKVRYYPGEDDNGNPTYWPKEVVIQKRKDMGPYVYSTQILLKPVTAENQTFDPKWITHFKNISGTNYYIICDPAGSKHKKSDSTVFWVVAVDGFKNKFVVDGIRDKLNLGERWRALKSLVIKWRPMNVGYEQYGLMSDVDYFKEKMAEEGCYFNLVKLQGIVSKTDRISVLVPEFESGKIKFPVYLPYRSIDGKSHDLVQEFIMDEYMKYPFCEHDDMLDCLARIKDPKLGVVYPMGPIPQVAVRKPGYDPLAERPKSVNWMAQ